MTAAAGERTLRAGSSISDIVICNIQPERNDRSFGSNKWVPRGPPISSKFGRLSRSEELLNARYRRPSTCAGHPTK